MKFFSSTFKIGLISCKLLCITVVSLYSQTTYVNKESPLIKLDSIVHPNQVYLFTGNDNQTLDYIFSDHSQKDINIKYNLTVFSHGDVQQYQHHGEFSIEANGNTRKSLVSKTSALAYGVYYALLEVINASDGKEIFTNKTYFGVGSATNLKKAKQGEFMYGMDVYLGHVIQNKYLLKWMEFTGTDILREGYWETNIKDVESDIPRYKDYNLKILFNYDVPKESDSTKRMEALKTKCNQLEEIARRFPEIEYYEAGNEPDLFGFYPGPIEEYYYSYKETYKAIKRGNPNAIVLNGGLAFFGEEGGNRSRKFIDLLDTTLIDYIAYHGHGPGATAEREAYLRMKTTLEKVNKFSKPLVDTETGVAAVTANQEEMQARTVLQKFVFAQSVNLPFIIWFRFIMFEEAYGNVYSEREPKPAVLSYRNTVETLRGYDYKKNLNLDKPGSEAHVFHENEGNGRVAVLWVNDPVSYNVTLKLASDNSQVDNLVVSDIYGNSRPIKLLADGTLRLEIDETPIILKWKTKDSLASLEKGAPVIDVNSASLLGVNIDNEISFQVKNPYKESIDAKLTISSQSAIHLVITPENINFKMKPEEIKSLKIKVRPESKGRKITWPEEWSAFTWVDNINLSDFTTVPSTLPAKGINKKGVKTIPSNFAIDFEKIEGRLEEQAVGIAFANINSQKDTTVLVGTSADWWMQCYINGKEVYSTMKHGNEATQTIGAHVFNLPLKKGNNLIAVKVLSGLGGWKLLFGNPEELQSLQNKIPDNIKFVLSTKSKIIEEDKTLVKFIKALKPLEAHLKDSPPETWDNEAPTAILKDKGVYNFFDKFPDVSKWWKGEKDVSATIWLKADERNVYLMVKVQDDKRFNSSTVDSLMNSDNIIVGIADNNLKKASNYIIGSVGKNTEVRKFTGADLTGTTISDKQISANIIQSSNTQFTYYKIIIPTTLFPGKSGYINLLVNDSDWGQRKQYISWNPGIGNVTNMTLWEKIVLP